MLLAGDIGGTKTVLALFSLEHGPNSPLVQKIFASHGHIEEPAAYGALQTEVRNDLGNFIYGKTKRRPMILPVIIPV